MCICKLNDFIVSLQADERPNKESGQPEAQGAGGEEQERPAYGGGSEERG